MKPLLTALAIAAAAYLVYRFATRRSPEAGAAEPGSATSSVPSSAPVPMIPPVATAAVPEIVSEPAPLGVPEFGYAAEQTGAAESADAPVDGPAPAPAPDPAPVDEPVIAESVSEVSAEVEELAPVAQVRAPAAPVGTPIFESVAVKSGVEPVATRQPEPQPEAEPEPEAQPELEPEAEAVLEPELEPQPVATEWSRRVSAFEEVRDGGYGLGSAGPVHDGAMPLGHPVQAYRDTMTFRTRESPGYDSAEPDVWFYDAESARSAGFSPAQDN